MNSRIDHEIESAHHVAPPPHKKSHAGFLILLLLIGLALGAAVYYELGIRKTSDKALVSSMAEDSGRAPVVNVGRVKAAPLTGAIELPCQTVAMVETPIYARADGYLKLRPVDIGSRVKKNDLLMEIETPELDQQIAQAQATIAQSRAALQQLRAALVAAQSNEKLADVTAARWKTLAGQGVFAKQDYDEKAAALELAQANTKSAQENITAAQSTIVANQAALDRLINLKSFDRVLAPYDGVVTFRSTQTDLGTLITSGNTSSSREMMRVAQIDVLRVFVEVPQTYAPLIHDGLPADLIVDELPGRVFHTAVKGITHSVDSSSRTMLAVLIVQNPKEELLPGMYVKARFSLPHTVKVLMLPADALLLPTEGPRVAVVGEDHKVHFVNVTLGRDYGATIEVHSGLHEGDAVILSPTDAVREGVTVEMKERGK